MNLEKTKVIPLSLCAIIAAEGYLLAETLNHTNLETIVVKSELQEKNLQDSQSSITIYSGLELDRSADTDLYDVIDRTPGVISLYGSKGIGIRGISQSDTTNITIDGLSIPTRSASYTGAYATWDLEQIEILRGPQSTQSGRNSLAGAVNLRTANPTFEQETKFRADYGSAKTTNLAIAHNQPLIDDILSVRVATEKSHSDGWVENITQNKKDYSDHDMTSARLKVLYKPVENLEAILGYSYTNNEAGVDYINISTWPEHSYSTTDENEDEKATHRITSLDLNYKMDEQWSIISKTGYYLSDYTDQEDTDNSELATEFWIDNNEGSSFTQEIKLSYQAEKLRGVFGLFYTNLDEESDTNYRYETTKYLSSSETNIDNTAVFGEFDYDFAQYWKVILGARYDQESNNFKSASTTDEPDATVSKENFDADYSAFLPKVGIVHYFHKNWSLGGTIQGGYRAGGAGFNSDTSSSYEYDPEYTTNYELSLRSTSLDKKTIFNVNVFYTDWKDMQVKVYASPGNTTNFIKDNSGSSSLYGSEISFLQRVNNNFNFYINGAYVKTEYKDYINRGTDYSGNEFHFAPKYMASIGAEYAFTGNWIASANADYQSDYYGNVGSGNEKEGKIDSRTLINAKFGYESDNWSAYIYSRNLTDEKYATQHVLKGGQRAVARIGEPRFIGLQINMEF